MNEETSNLRQNAVKFSRSRANLIAVTAFTLVNVLLIYFESDWYLLFSATLPWYFMLQAMMDVPIFGFDAQTIAYIVLAFSGVILYFLFWLLSGRFRWFMLIAMIFFAADTIFLAYLIMELSMFDSFDAGFILDAAFQIWIMFYLVTGTIAWAKLRGVTREQLDSVKTAIDKEEANTAIDQLSNDENKENEDNRQV